MAESTLDFHIIIVALIILLVSFCFCYLPIYASSFNRLRKHFQFISACAVGLLLAVLILDITPHVILGPCIGHNHKDSHGDGHSHKYSHEHNHKPPYKYKNSSLIMSGIAFITLLSIDTLFLHHGECETSVRNKQKTECVEKYDHNHDEIYNESPESLGLCNTSSIKNSKSVIQALIFVMAISIHSFLEGLAVKRSGNKFSSYDFALIVHKILESIGLSISIQQTKFSPKVFFLLFTIFSISTPFAMLMSVMIRPDTLLFSLANGAAMGSVLFIVFVEMIPSLFHGHTSKSSIARLIKLICFLITFLISAGLIIYSHKKIC